MSLKEKVNLTKPIDLEEGEISDSNINNQAILKLIESKNENLKKKNLEENKSSPHIIPKEIISCEDSEEEEESGFFHKLLKQVEPKSEEKFLKTKRKTSVPLTERPYTESKKTEKKNGKKINNKKLTHKKENEKKPKQICQYYINGACSRGSSCGFSHEVEQVKKDEVCKYFITGACTKGEECLFSHDMSSFPCKFFHALGCCVNGDNCKFSHQRLSESEIFSFIMQNEDFLVHLYKTMGRTNMDDYLFKFLEDKNRNVKTKSNETIMLPPSLINENKNNNNINPNFTGQMRNFNPLNNSNQSNSNYAPTLPTIPAPNFFQMMQLMQMNNLMTRNMHLNQNQFANNQNKFFPNQINQQNTDFSKLNPQILMNLALKNSNTQIQHIPNFSSKPSDRDRERSNESGEVIFNSPNIKNIELNNLMSQINPFQKPVSNHSNISVNTQSKNLESDESEEEETNFFHKMKKVQQGSEKKENESLPKDPRNRMRKK